MTRHLLAIHDLNTDRLRGLIDEGSRYADQAPTDDTRDQLRGETVAQLFYEPSTRTRCSFELAARRLGADVLNLDLDTASTTKGETVIDTVRTLAAMGVRFFVMRHGDADTVAAVADALPDACHLLNAGAGTSQHPTQALLDMLTLHRAGYNFNALDIGIVGDIAHSRVASSTITALQRLGVPRIRLGGPPAFLPDTAPEGATLCHKLADAVAGADVVMTLRIQRERMPAELAGDVAAYHREWGLTDARIDELAPAARIMHPGPVNRGVEIDDGLADGDRSLILDQVSNGVPARMAALAWLHRGDD